MTRKIWKRENYHVEIIEEDGWHKILAVVYNGEIIYTISPATKAAQEDIMKALDDGEEVVGWEDGAGNTIWIPDYIDESGGLTTEQGEWFKDKGYTVYYVSMVKGTDNAYDETSEPDTLLITLDREKALSFYDTLPKVVELEEPEADMDGREIYETPVVAQWDGKADANLIREG